MADRADLVARGTKSIAWLLRFRFSDRFQNLEDSEISDRFLSERSGTGEKLIEDDPERVDVGTDIDVMRLKVGLFGAHVLDGAHQLTDFCEQRFIG